MIVTRGWLDTICSPSGGWSRDTLAKLGISWPPKSGWKDLIIGTNIEWKPGDSEWSIDFASWTWPFGVHRGKRLHETPLPYLEWVAREFKSGAYKKACKREIARRDPVKSGRIGISADEPGGVQGHYDCSSQFDPLSDWAVEQVWDVSSAPWEDQIGSDELSQEFRQMFQSV